MSCFCVQASRREGVRWSVAWGGRGPENGRGAGGRGANRFLGVLTVYVPVHYLVQVLKRQVQGAGETGAAPAKLEFHGQERAFLLEQSLFFIIQFESIHNPMMWVEVCPVRCHHHEMEWVTGLCTGFKGLRA